MSTCWRGGVGLAVAVLLACSSPSAAPPRGGATPDAGPASPGRVAPSEKADGGVARASALVGAGTVVPERTGAEGIHRITLELLAPTPFDPYTTARVRMRQEPSSGERERVGEVAVTSRCTRDSCFDGLRDLRTGRDLLPTAPTPDEQEVLAAPGRIQRVVRIAHVSEEFVSVYLGSASYSGGARADNALECATFERRTGQRVALLRVVSSREAQRLTREASRMLKDYLEQQAEVAHALHPSSFLHDAASGRVSLCAEGDTPVAGSALVLTPL